MESVIFIVVLALFVMVAIWYTTTCGDSKIKFEKFKEYYTENPNKWQLYEDWVFYIKGLHVYSFHFGFIDYYRYRIWLHKHKCSRGQLALKSIEQDINRNKEA